MSEEEKRAIEHLKKRMDICLENADICDENNFDEEATYLRKEQIFIETILTLIENQQSEIIQYEKALHDQIIKDYDMELELKVELEKKDKIINLMSEQLTSPIHSKEWVIEYYTKEVEDN